jgi:hypothetical protein
LASSPLFDLISLAGNASLGELRARSFAGAAALAHEIAAMLREGTVKLSANPIFKGAESTANVDPSLEQVLDLSASGGSKELMAMREDDLAKTIESVLGNDEASEHIIVVPTSKGFRRSL